MGRARLGSLDGGAENGPCDSPRGTVQLQSGPLATAEGCSHTQRGRLVPTSVGARSADGAVGGSAGVSVPALVPVSALALVPVSVMALVTVSVPVSILVPVAVPVPAPVVVSECVSAPDPGSVAVWPM